MIVDGRAIATEILVRAKARAAALSRAPRVLAIVANETPATKSYLSIKGKRAVDAGCTLDILRFPEDTSTAALRAAVLSADADAIIVQLPLPIGVDTREVCNAIPVGKDADVLSVGARAIFESDAEGALLPPVVGAVDEIFKRNGVVVAGKNAVVIGAGFLVGVPVANWLLAQGAHVDVVTSASGNMTELLRTVDIVVSGAGSPHLIKPSMLTPGVILIDAATSESNGIIVGDIDPACAEIASLFTPVPGGVGPIAVALLFENTVTLAERTTNS
ncbi:MAG: bifunctional 5,10-methylenetetrahydrofolate dehydrogenase/5,10-methenyltetrahydrofolate cyclohydrolase [Minisyncoccia bacterium]